MKNIKRIDFEEKPELIIEMTFSEPDLSASRAAHLEEDENFIRPKRLIEGIATVADIDDNFIEVTPDALRNAENDLLLRSTILENHDMSRPIGRVLESSFDPLSKSLLIRGFVSMTEDVVWQKIQEGVLNKFSISWRSLDFEEVFDDKLGMNKVVVHDMRIFEVSIVSVPAIAEADLTGWVERTLREHKVGLTRAAPYKDPLVTPFRRDPASSREKRWDAPSAVRRLKRRAGGPNKTKIDWGVYAEGFAYIRVDGTRFSDYVFPIRDVVNGRLVSVFRAVSAAAGKLENSSVPDEDKRAIAERLLKEYRSIHKIDEEDIPESLIKLVG